MSRPHNKPTSKFGNENRTLPFLPLAAGLGLRRAAPTKWEKRGGAVPLFPPPAPAVSDRMRLMQEHKKKEAMGSFPET